MSAGEGNVTIEVRLNEGGETGELVIRGEISLLLLSEL